MEAARQRPRVESTRREEVPHEEAGMDRAQKGKASASAAHPPVFSPGWPGPPPAGVRRAAHPSRWRTVPPNGGRPGGIPLRDAPVTWSERDGGCRCRMARRTPQGVARPNASEEARTEPEEELALVPGEVVVATSLPQMQQPPACWFAQLARSFQWLSPPPSSPSWPTASGWARRARTGSPAAPSPASEERPTGASESDEDERPEWERSTKSQMESLRQLAREGEGEGRARESQQWRPNSTPGRQRMATGRSQEADEAAAARS